MNDINTIRELDKIARILLKVLDRSRDLDDEIIEVIDDAIARLYDLSSEINDSDKV